MTANSEAPATTSSAPSDQGKQVAATRFRLGNSAVFQSTDTHADLLSDHLRSSLQMQHLLMLAGSGTSIESGGPSMADLWDAAKAIPDFDKAIKMTGYNGGEDIEAFLSRCDAFLELTPQKKPVSHVREATIAMILRECRGAGASGAKLQAHRELLKKVARRRARDSRMRLLTTNYDLCFEQAAAELGLIPIDGFSFSNPRHFDPRYFDYDIVKRSSGSEGVAFVPGVFHYYKLHGSVDWSNNRGQVEIDPEVAAKDACLRRVAPMICKSLGLRGSSRCPCSSRLRR